MGETPPTDSSGCGGLVGFILVVLLIFIVVWNLIGNK